MFLENFLLPKKSPRHLRGAPCYYQVGPLIPSIGRSAEEAKAKAEAGQKEKAGKEKQAKQAEATSKAPAPKTPTLPQKTRESSDPRESREEVSHREAEHKATLTAAKQSAAQALQESTYEIRQQPQAGTSFRPSGSTGSNVLQNARALTGESHPDPQSSASAGEKGVGAFLKGDPSRVEKGMRAGNFGIWGSPTQEQTSASATRTPFRPFSPETPFAGLASKALLPWNATAFATLLKQMSQKLPNTHPAFTQAAIAATLHGNLMLVRDGNRTRSYRLLQDGTLYDTHGEQAGTPLSKEARAELIRVLKEKGLHARLSGEKEALVEKHQMARKGIAQDHSLAARGEFRALFKDESSFAHLLREVLEEGKNLGQPLEEGEDPHFANKSDWSGFFTRMLNLGNSQKSTQKKLDDIISFMFRGLFKKKGEAGETLVSDIKYSLTGLKKEDKFAQIGIDNHELLELLRNFEPGQAISKDLFQKFMGNEITFVQLLHVIGQTDPAYASEILKHVKFDPTANVDAYSQARLEHLIFSKSREKKETKSPTLSPIPVLEEKQKREVFGKPKLYTLLTYLLILFGLFLILWWVFK